MKVILTIIISDCDFLIIYTLTKLIENIKSVEIKHNVYNFFFNWMFFLKKEFFFLKFLLISKKIKNHHWLEWFSLLFFFFIWLKIRVLYYTNNWIYTTNHKRIAVNYFWFVILAGIVGMVLATIIRMELAYPGVGVFAGDSLQYLSIVTAHGVVMVFFMIMPLLFGAFANFLLPTQLGVHDVAFPRLNSAAFWFLPAGLIMLAQLVCVDRRYQRMNAFNIKEIQSVLKRKFFTDLQNSSEFNSLLDKTMIKLKYKTNSLQYLNSHSHLNYNFGLKKILNKNENFLNTQNSELNFSNKSFFFKKLNFFYLNYFNFFFYYSQIFSYEFIKLDFKLNFLFSIFYFIYYLSFSFLSFFFFYIFNFFKFFFFYLYTLFIYFFNAITFYFTTFLYYFDYVEYWVVFSYIIPFLKLWIFFCISKIKDFLIYFLSFHLFSDLFLFSKFFFFDFYTLLIFLFKFFTFYFNFFISYLKEINWKTLPWFFILTGKHLFTLDEEHKFLLEIYKNDFSFFMQLSNIYKNTLSNENKNYFLNFKLVKKPSILPSILLEPSISYPHFFFFFFLNLPFIIFNFIISIYNTRDYSIKINKFWFYITNWILPLFFDINFLFYFLFDFLNFKIFSFFLFFLKTVPLTFLFFFKYFIPLFFKDFIIIYRYFFYFLYNINFKNYFFFFDFNFFSFLQSVISNILLFLNMIPFFFFFDVNFFKYLFNFFNKKFNFFFSKQNHFYKNYINDNNDLLSFENTHTRFLKFNNPVYKYDYKSGDYFPKFYKETYWYLFTSLLNITSAVKPNNWIYSNNFLDLLKPFNKKIEFSLINDYQIRIFNYKNSPILSFHSFFFNSIENFNTRWVSFFTLNQKFYKMFLTNSMQQRIYNNWRQLKFTREAWRCKLLASRHQKTLFKRYVHEDGVFWSIERNAKDLLPGWAMITPFSSHLRFTAVGKVDIGLMGVLLVLNSSIISGANFLVTYRYLSTLNNRKMRDARAFFTEGIMVTSWMMILANPMLVIGIIMLLSDRHWQTSFFDYSGGGDTILFQHMFWFFGHPEVYVIMIPVFGFTNTILSYYLRKRVSARASLMYSMYTIAFLGFFVWGHHMYMVGLAHTTRMLFSTLTVMISVPAATKLMHWCVTMANSVFVVELPFLFVLTFIFFFVSGGISGMYVAHTGMDILFHDTFYVIGHFHVMLAGGAMFGSFGAFYFYFPAIFGVKYSRTYAYLHFTYYLIGQLMTFVPMFWLGYAGMPRRILDYPASLGGWHSVISAGHMLSVAGLISFFIMIFDSIRQGKAVTRNTFGLNRLNTRLNFYLFENARSIHIQRKNFFLFKPFPIILLKLNKKLFFNFEPLETTLFSYVLLKK